MNTPTDYAATHVAAVSYSADVVAGDFCEVTVAEADVDGTDVVMSDRVVLDAAQTTVPVGNPDGRQLAAEADDILRSHGFTRTGEWTAHTGASDALYATAVEL